MKSLVILGSSGSIGENTLQVVAAHPGRFRVRGLAVHHATDKLLEQARRFGVERVAVADATAAARLRGKLPAGLTLLAGEEGLEELAATTEAEMVVCALVGMAGLRPVLAAIRAGRDVALATKEVLVAAGEPVMQERAARNVRILPVDSEHSAIFQCLQSAAFAPCCVRAAGAQSADGMRSKAAQGRFEMVLNGVARQLALPAAVALAVVGDAEGYAHGEASGMGWVCIKLSVFHGGMYHRVTRNRHAAPGQAPSGFSLSRQGGAGLWP